jgi:hypothetical protein
MILPSYKLVARRQAKIIADLQIDDVLPFSKAFLGGSVVHGPTRSSAPTRVPFEGHPDAARSLAARGSLRGGTATV